MERTCQKSWTESKRTWEIAGPAVLTGVMQCSIGVVTIAFAGHLGDVQLAAVTLGQSVIECFAFGFLLGMGSALETLCGQAVGAKQLTMLGIYMQRSFIITLTTSAILTPIYIFSAPILKLLHQDPEITHLAQKFTRWTLPQLFAYALNFPLQKFLQSQSRVWVMAIVSGVGLAVHVILNWVLVTKLGLGLVGAAVAGNVSWWVVVLGQMVYVVSGFFREAWTGFSWLAVRDLGAFVKLSLASAVMLCLEIWYFTAVIILVGCLKDPEIEVSAISICMNIQLWTFTVALGFNAAVSVRVSNELGAGHPKAAKFAVLVSVLTSGLLGLIFMAIILITRKHMPKLFTDIPELIKETSKLGYLLAITIILNSIQPVLSGVAVGAGWQSTVAIINTCCYYLVGLPIGAVLGFKYKLKAMGIWSGMLGGTLLQTVILLFITHRTKWQNEAMQAEERIKEWGGATELESIPPKNPSISQSEQN